MSWHPDDAYDATALSREEAVERLSLVAIIARLRSEISVSGSQAAWARRHGVGPGILSDVLSGKRPPTPSERAGVRRAAAPHAGRTAFRHRSRGRPRRGPAPGRLANLKRAVAPEPEPGAPAGAEATGVRNPLLPPGPVDGPVCDARLLAAHRRRFGAASWLFLKPDGKYNYNLPWLDPADDLIPF